MTSLYTRLFTYREREGRSPLEDFLSEALADLLNRLPSSHVRNLVTFMLGERPDILSALAGIWPEHGVHHWSTQVAVGGQRRADLTLEVDGRALLIVENKIAAGFQEHEAAGQVEGASVQARQDQLATYGQWLAERSDAEWGGALVLLTHWTPAPVGFLEGAEHYAVQHRATTRWSDLSRWLTTQVRDEGSVSNWAALARDLVTFLKEQSMDSEIATSRDWAALQIYLVSADRVRNSVERLWEGARASWFPICQQTNNTLEVSTEYGCVWKYRYLYRSDLRKAYLAVGIRYPEATEYLSDLIPDGMPYLFVELGHQNGSGILTALTMPTGWTAADDLWLATYSLRNLPGDADNFLARAEPWVREQISEVAEALS